MKFLIFDYTIHIEDKINMSVHIGYKGYPLGYPLSKKVLGNHLSDSVYKLTNEIIYLDYRDKCINTTTYFADIDPNNIFIPHQDNDYYTPIQSYKYSDTSLLPIIDEYIEDSSKLIIHSIPDMILNLKSSIFKHIMISCNCPICYSYIKQLN